MRKRRSDTKQVDIDHKQKPIDENNGEKRSHEELFDKLNQPLTEVNKGAFMDAEELKEIEKHLRSTIRRVHELAAHNIGAYIASTRVDSLLENAADSLKQSRPFCNCPQCSGEGCRSCKDSGYITKLIYDQLPKDEDATSAA